MRTPEGDIRGKVWLEGEVDRILAFRHGVRKNNHPPVVMDAQNALPRSIGIQGQSRRNGSPLVATRTGPSDLGCCVVGGGRNKFPPVPPLHEVDRP